MQGPPKESELLRRGPVHPLLSSRGPSCLSSGEGPLTVQATKESNMEVYREPSPGAGLLNKALLALHTAPHKVDTVKGQGREPRGQLLESPEQNPQLAITLGTAGASHSSLVIPMPCGGLG